MKLNIRPKISSDKEPMMRTLRRYLYYSLRTRMIMAFLVITLIPVGIFAYLNYRSTRTALIESANLALFAAASQTATAIDGFLDSKLEQIYHKSLLPELVTYLDSLDKQQMNSELQRNVRDRLGEISLRRFENYTVSTGLLNLHGTNVLDTFLSNMGQDESSQAHFQMALKSRRPYISPPHFPARGIASVYFSAPVARSPNEAFRTFSRDWEYVGVVRVAVSMAILQQLVTIHTELAGEKSFAMIVDENHVLLAHSNAPELLFKSLVPLDSDRIMELQADGRLPARSSEDLSTHLPLFEQGLGHVENTPFFVAHTKPDVEHLDQMAVMKLRNQPWFVVFAQPQEEFLKPVRKQTRLAIALAGVVGILVVAAAVIMARMLTAPIIHLTEAAEQISQGDLTPQVHVDTPDEIGQLGHTFNNMTERLRRTLNELQHHQNHLEELVDERTAELSEANTQLRLEIDERTRIEHELQRAKDDALEAQRRAEAANLAKSTFLANMSHELRTPLNAVIGFAELIKLNKTIPPESEQYLAILMRNGDYLLSLINQILDLSKIEAGQITLNEQEFDLYGLCSEIETMFSFKAEYAGIMLKVEHIGHVPRFIRTDEVKLRQVLINLLSNAIKFTEEGEVTLRVNAMNVGVVECRNNGKESNTAAISTLQHSNTPTLYFEISDTGPGIAPDEINHLFDAFMQTETGRKSQQGTGLGLTISRRFVQLMGGEISVRSEVEQGTTFTFWIQAGIAEMPKPASVLATSRIIGLETGQPRYHILLADDEADNRQLLKEILIAFDFELHEVTNGQEALAAWEVWHPHLIWMDLRMPVMDGYEATKRIRALGSEHSVPGTEPPVPSHRNPVIIAVTASVFEEERAKVLAAGFDDFLRKPFRRADVLAILQKHLVLRFVYEQSEAMPTPSQVHLRPEDLLTLPDHLKADLKQAAEALDLSAIYKAIRQIHQHNANLATTLTELAREFRLDILQRMYETISVPGVDDD